MEGVGAGIGGLGVLGAAGITGFLIEDSRSSGLYSVVSVLDGAESID